MKKNDLKSPDHVSNKKKNNILSMIGLTVKFLETYRIDQDFNQCMLACDRACFHHKIE